MDAEWTRLKHLFNAALEQPAEQRKPFLDGQCAGDPDLRKKVEMLLGAHGRTPAMLEEPTRLPRELVAAEEAPSAAGERIGRYTVRRLVAVGGMGLVYEAEQDRPKRIVALKILRRGLMSRSALQRFQHESEILSRLRHPNIAQIYEAGTIGTEEDGRPFFAMEFISGRPLMKHAQEAALGTRERLALFAKICDAVHHAHQKGVIHRDLKPANILIDERGEPKILDFGIARSTDADLQTTTLQTDIGQLIGTVAYMSPEQAAGDADALDTRSDVYALGVLCYELLADRLPYDVSKKMVHEAVRVIREEEPTSLSSVNRVFRGDVDIIVGKALEKETERRYQSASDLAADIRRYLGDQPIAARRPSTRYQLKKFARRHVGLVLGLAATFAVLCLGIGALAWQWTLTRQEANRATSINRFFQKVLSANELAGAGRRLEYTDILDYACQEIDDDLGGTPAGQADIRHLLGTAYLEIGHFKKAETQLEMALAMRRELYGDADERTLESLENLGRALIPQGQGSARGKAFVDLLESGFETRAAIHGEDHPATLAAMHLWARSVAQLFRKRYDEAEDLYRETIDRSRDVLGDAHPTTLQATQDFVDLLVWRHRFAQAEPLCRRVFDTLQKHLGDTHPKTIESRFQYADLLWKWERPEESSSLMEQVVARADAALSTDHWRRWEYHHIYGRLLTGMRRYEEAETHLLAGHQGLIRTEARGPSHDTLTAIAELYDAWNKPSEAEHYYRQVLDERNQFTGPVLRLETRNDIARMLVLQGRFEEAEELFLSIKREIPALVDFAHWWRGWFQACYGLLLLKQGHHEEAEQQLEQGLEWIRRGEGIRSRQEEALAVIEALIALNESIGKTEKASDYRDELAYWRIYDDYGRAFILSGEYENAEAYLLPRYTYMQSRFGESGPQTQDVHDAIVELYEAWNKPDEAAKWRARLPELRGSLPVAAE